MLLVNYLSYFKTSNQPTVETSLDTQSCLLRLDVTVKSQKKKQLPFQLGPFSGKVNFCSKTFDFLDGQETVCVSVHKNATW